MCVICSYWVTLFYSIQWLRALLLCIPFRWLSLDWNRCRPFAFWPIMMRGRYLFPLHTLPLWVFFPLSLPGFIQKKHWQIFQISKTKTQHQISNQLTNLYKKLAFPPVPNWEIPVVVRCIRLASLCCSHRFGNVRCSSWTLLQSSSDSPRGFRAPSQFASLAVPRLDFNAWFMADCLTSFLNL